VTSNLTAGACAIKAASSVAAAITCSKLSTTISIVFSARNADSD
jgi:hypothetical protein